MSFESDLARKVIAEQADALPTAFGRISISIKLLHALVVQLEAAELAVGFQSALMDETLFRFARRQLIAALWRRAATNASREFSTTFARALLDYDFAIDRPICGVCGAPRCDC